MVDRTQRLLFPPSLKDEIAQHHLARIVIDAVVQPDLTAIAAAYYPKDWECLAIDAWVMVATLLYV